MDYKDYTLVELRQMAKEQGIKNVSKLKRNEIEEILENSKNSDSSKEVKENKSNQISNSNIAEENINSLKRNYKNFKESNGEINHVIEFDDTKDLRGFKEAN